MNTDNKNDFSYKEEDTVVKTVGIIMLIVLLGKATGLLRDILTARTYGTSSMEARAFTLASTIPRNFLDFTLASTISASFIPVFNEFLTQRGKEEAFELSHKFITLIFLLSLGMTFILFLFAPELIHVIGHKFNPETQELALQLVRIILPTIIFSGLAFSLTGVLESLNEFKAPAFMSVVSNLLIIGYFIFFEKVHGVVGLSIIYTLGWFSQLLVLAPSLYKRGYFFKWNMNFKGDYGLRKIGKLTIPVLVTGWVQPVNQMVNSAFAGEDMTSLSHAYTLYSVISGVFVLSIANVIFPRLSRMASSEKADMGEGLNTTLSGMLFLLIPLTGGILLLSTPLIRLLFEGGDFTSSSTLDTSKALVFYTLGMVGFGIQTIVSRGFFAKQEGLTPLFTGIFSMLVNLVLSYTLTPLLGVGGPALAWSISISLTSIIMLIIMSKKENIWNRKDTFNILKVIVSTSIMMFFVLQIRKLQVGDLLEILLSGIVGVLIYFICIFLFKTKEGEMMKKAFYTWRQKNE